MRIALDLKLGDDTILYQRDSDFSERYIYDQYVFCHALAGGGLLPGSQRLQFRVLICSPSASVADARRKAFGSLPLWADPMRGD